jgi:hypothetical protein
MIRKITLVALASLAAILSVGCGLTSPFIAHKDFTRPNYETIRIGESKQEVLDMMGQPTTELDETWIYVNAKPYYKALIEFEQGKVTHKRFTIDKCEDLTTASAPAPSTKPAKRRPSKVF